MRHSATLLFFWRYVWNGLLIYVGVFLGARWREVAGVAHYLIIGAVVSAVVAFAVFLVMRRKRRAARLHL
jgi:membrane protein DedA with SNARE-associated domain